MIVNRATKNFRGFGAVTAADVAAAVSEFDFWWTIGLYCIENKIKVGEGAAQLPASIMAPNILGVMTALNQLGHGSAPKGFEDGLRAKFLECSDETCVKAVTQTAGAIITLAGGSSILGGALDNVIDKLPAGTKEVVKEVVDPLVDPKNDPKNTPGGYKPPGGSQTPSMTGPIVLAVGGLGLLLWLKMKKG